MTEDLRELLHELVADPPAGPDWVPAVRHRARQRARSKATTTAALLALTATAAAVPLAMSRHGQSDRLVPAAPPVASLTLSPSITEAAVGAPVEFTAVATAPDGPPVIQDALIDASGATVGECPAPPSGAGISGSTARRTFTESFDQAGVHRLEVSALMPGCQDGSLKASALVQVTDSRIELTNDITIVAKVLRQPQANKSDLVLDVTATGSREKPDISGFYIEGDVLFLGDRCKPLGIMPSRGPGVFHEVYRYRYKKAGTDRITLFASSLCRPSAGQASLTIKVNVTP